MSSVLGGGNSRVGVAGCCLKSWWWAQCDLLWPQSFPLPAYFQKLVHLCSQKFCDCPISFSKCFSHISLVSVLCLYQRASCLHPRALMSSLAVLLLPSHHILCCSQCLAPQSLWRWQADHPLLSQTSLSFMEPVTRVMGIHCQF